MISYWENHCYTITHNSLLHQEYVSTQIHIACCELCNRLITMVYISPYRGSLLRAPMGGSMYLWEGPIPTINKLLNSMSIMNLY